MVRFEAQSWEVFTSILGLREIRAGNTVAAVTVLTDRSGPRVFWEKP